MHIRIQKLGSLEYFLEAKLKGAYVSMHTKILLRFVSLGLLKQQQQQNSFWVTLCFVHF